MAPVGLNSPTQVRCEEGRIEAREISQGSMAKGTPSALTKQNLKLLEKSYEQDGITHGFDVHNTLRAEQVHSFNEQQGLILLGRDKAPEDHLKPPNISPFSQPAASASNRHRHSELRQSSGNEHKPSSRNHQSQLDADLKLYSPLARSSNDHPALRFLSPGAPGDPPIFLRQALKDLETPYADGSSAESRLLIGIRNSEPFTAPYER